MAYSNRYAAGQVLARSLGHLRAAAPLVLGLPRGGVPVAYAVAESLGAQLDIILVRKLGVPTHRELAFGAIGEGGVRVLNASVVRETRLTEQDIAAVEQHELAELARRADALRGGHPPTPMARRTAVIVDDGIATGATVIAACQVAHAARAQHVVVAVPVAAHDAIARVRGYAHSVICPLIPSDLSAVGAWYDDFTQVPESDVVSILARARSASTS
jgi:putative phosphoribosyl transferase